MPTGDLFAPVAATKAREAGRTLLAHCDGGARGNPGPAGYGAVIATEDGTVLAELSEFLGFKTNNFAEYSGLLGVLQWALDHNHSRIRVVSDSELMVKQIQGKYKVNSPDLKPLWEEARRRIAKLDHFTISHALRAKNKTADRLANEAMDRGTGRPAAASPLKATPYPTRSTEPPAPKRLDPLTPEPPASTTPSPLRAEPSAISVPRPQAPPAPLPVQASASTDMLRGFVKDGTIVLLGGKTLPDGIFVKIIRE